MDVVDDIIDLFYQYSRAHFIGNGEGEVFIDDEPEFRKRPEKLLMEK